MKKLPIFLISALIFTGCPNAGDLPERIPLKIVITGLEFTSGEPDSLKSATDDIFDEFEYNYEHTDLTFWGERSNYSFSTGTISAGINTYMAVGNYQVDGYGGWANPLGSPLLSFHVRPLEVKVESGTTELEILADPDCGLILLADPLEQLEDAYITGNGNPGVPFTKQGIYRFTFVQPDPSFQAHIVKKNTEELVLNLNEISVGKTYKIEVIQE